MFKNKTAIVTGASGGMGEAITVALANAGCNVTAIDINPHQETLANLPNVTYAQGDLTDEQFVNKTIKTAYQQTGRLDYLVNVAGALWFDRDKSIFDMDIATWDRIFDINLKSMIHTARASTPLMKQSGNGGAMVHFSTIQWMRGDTKPQDAYQASKAAVCAFSKSLAMQLAEHNIRSNTICPGPTLTPMQARWDTEEKQQNVANHVPLQRLGTPEDMANATLFLLSDQSSFITGIDLPVDGGMLMRP